MEIIDISKGLFPFVGIGFIFGCIPLVFGLWIQMLINAIKSFYLD